MTYNTGTATGHLDMLDQLIQVCTGRHMATVAVNAGGTGHAVGDIIDITATGATSTEVAKIEVVTLSGSAILTARVYRGGVYTVDPTTTTANAQTATTGSGTGATFDITFDNTGWTQVTRQSKAVTSAPTVSTGGSGYAVSDVLTLVGGVLAPGGAAATFTVSTVSGGVVTAVTNTTVGDYEVVPSNPAQTTNDGSGDNACTLTVTYENTTGDTIVILQGDAGANTDPVIGIKTYSNFTDERGLETVYNWALFGISGYSSLLNLHAQANISDGFNASIPGNLTASTTGDGAFVPLKDTSGIAIQWAIRATKRSITASFRVEGASTVYYPWASFGLLNQYGITSEYSYPAYVAGTSDRPRVWFSDTLSLFGGLAQVITRSNGPMFVWTPEGTWEAVKNQSIAANQSLSITIDTSNIGPMIQLFPLGEVPIRNTDDQIWTPSTSAGFDHEKFALPTGAIQIYRTPDTGGDLTPLFPLVPMQADGTIYRAFGEIDGVWWVPGNDASVSSQDRIVQGANAYTIFQSGTQIDTYSFAAIEEN